MDKAMKTKWSERLENEGGRMILEGMASERSGYLIRDSNNEKQKAMQR